MTKSIISKFALTGAASITAMAISIAAAQAQAMEFDIEAQPLSTALLEFNEQAGVIVMVSGDLVEGKFSPAVQGSMEPEDALDKILSGSGLKAADAPNGAYTITLASASLGEGSSPEPFRVAQLDQEENRAVTLPSDRGVDDDDQERDTIIVTGTNIRGAAPVGSPLQQFTREEIERSGRGTVQEFFETVPQNFGGGITQDGFLDGSGGDFNQDARAGLNLRGLGNGATLVLLNGNRMAAGVNGAFVDISVIPTSAIERIEVLPDGASAIYGSDAISGVVNLVLRDDFEGAETSFRFGSVTEGTQSEIRATQTLGENWGSGQALLSYDYFSRTELSTNERSFTEDFPGTSSLVPDSENHSIFGNISQDIGDKVELHATGFYGQRATETAIVNPSQGFQAFGDVNVEQLNFTGGLSARLGGEWIGDLSATFARDSSDRLGETINTLTGMSIGEDGNTTTDLYVVDAKLGGPLFQLPSGPLRVAFGGQYRSEELQTEALRTIDGVTGDPTSRSADREIFAIFGEAIIPVIGDDKTSPLGKKLDLSFAGRYENYSDFGSTFDPKLGISYQPVDGFVLRASYSTSFRAPLLFDLDPLSQFANTVNTPFFPDPSSPNGFVPFIFLNGSNPDLQPETSENWTVGVDITPLSVSGLSFSATYFDIAYEGRISNAATGIEVLRIFVDPIYQPIITRNPDIATVNEFFARPNFANPFAVDPEDIEAIANNALTNLSSTIVRGIDFSLGYQFDTGVGSFNLRSSGSLYLDFENRLTDTAAPVSVLDTAFNPVDFRIINSIGWNKESWGANIAVNYVDGYETFAFPPTEPVSSWTTVDLGLSYRVGDNDTRSLLQNINISLNIQNLFAEDPPFVNAGDAALQFDATNANPLGRFVSVQINKRW